MSTPGILSPAMRASLDALAKSYTPGAADNIGELTLPGGWLPLSLGGDKFKLLAINEEFGFVAKRYAHQTYAELVNKSYEAIRPEVERAKFPLLLPFGCHHDILVFPYIQEVLHTEIDRDVMQILKGLTTEIPINIEYAGYLDRLNHKSGFYYNDPFEDSVNNLMKHTGQCPIAS